LKKGNTIAFNTLQTLYPHKTNLKTSSSSPSSSSSLSYQGANIQPVGISIAPAGFSASASGALVAPKRVSIGKLGVVKNVQGVAYAPLPEGASQPFHTDEVSLPESGNV
jgi:hypothetical protein